MKDKGKAPPTLQELEKEPVKSFLQVAQQEFRVYIALENAWPRKKGRTFEQEDAPVQILRKVRDTYKQYKNESFRETYDWLMGFPPTQKVMVTRVSPRNYEVKM